MKNTNTHYLHRSSRLFTAVLILIALLSMTVPAHEIDQTSRVIGPDLIPISAGFKAEGIEMGKNHDFFVGTLSWSGNLTNAGTIYKGNLPTGEGRVLVPPAGKPVAGLSYLMHARIIFNAATGHSGGLVGPRWE